MSLHVFERGVQADDRAHLLNHPQWTGEISLLWMESWSGWSAFPLRHTPQGTAQAIQTGTTTA